MPGTGSCGGEEVSQQRLADHGKGLEVTRGETGAIAVLQLGSDVVRWERAMVGGPER